MRTHTKDSIAKEIKALGLGEGDVVFIAADLLKIGYFVNDRAATLADWLDILIGCVGQSGTLVIPAYTKSFLKFKKDPSIIFHKDSPTTSGSLSVAFGSLENVVRSCHPTNSLFAYGKLAKEVLRDHDENSTSYMPYQRIIDLNGKHLMLGTISDIRLGPMTLHSAQETLGLTKKNWSAGLLQTYVLQESGRAKLFTRRDVGGCTSGAYKSYGHHITAGAINIGVVGNSLSACIDCHASYNIFIEILKTDPNFLKCDNHLCRDCFGSPIHRKIPFWLRYCASTLYRKYSAGDLKRYVDR